MAGDVRALEQPGLTAMHSLFLNEHNRLALLIYENYPHLSDEEIYQVVRKIVGAEMQNIVYNEFLPLVLGNDALEEFDLKLPNNAEENTNYDENVNATISNEFATVAFRFAHSLIPSHFLPTLDPVRVSDISCPLKQNFFHFDQFSIGTDNSARAWENLLLGIQYQQSPAMDTAMSNSVIDFLFCGEHCLLPEGFGQDLAARNIQRGRDHGLPSYAKFREFCNLPKLTNWSSKPINIKTEIWDKLQSVYVNVDDIDPFTGGLAEDSVPDGLVGKTFSCIIGQQFEVLKNGDRFFFTHNTHGEKSEKGLPQETKSAIRNRRLSDIICDNTGTESNPLLVMKQGQQNETCFSRPSFGFEEIKPMLSNGE